jgi:hypothetical protein
MNKPYNIQNTNICNGIFHISYFKALLINEGETTQGETTRGKQEQGRNDSGGGAKRIRGETTRYRRDKNVVGSGCVCRYIVYINKMQ